MYLFNVRGRVLCAVEDDNVLGIEALECVGLKKKKKLWLQDEIYESNEHEDLG